MRSGYKRVYLVKKIYVIFFLIFLDFLSKKIVFNYVKINSLIEIFPFFDLTHIHNYGISFGLLSGFISPKIIVLIGLIVTLLIYFIYIQSSEKLEKWGLIMIISGALSNILDRILNNYVLDFISLHYNDFYWPAFNFADIYITIGVLIIIYQIVKAFGKRLSDDNV